MKRFTLALALSALIAISFVSCAHNPPAVISPDAAVIKRVYVWDADGATDMALLKALKAETAAALKGKGLVVSDDPTVTDAYAKVTVLESSRDEERGRSHIQARLYLVNAVDGTVIYDKTAEAVRDGKGAAAEYPAGEVVRELLEELPKRG